jgi:hypothetical protein
MMQCSANLLRSRKCFSRIWYQIVTISRLCRHLEPEVSIIYLRGVERQLQIMNNIFLNGGIILKPPLSALVRF